MAIVTDFLPIRFLGNHSPGYNDSHVQQIWAGFGQSRFHHVLTKEFVQHFENINFLDVGWSNMTRINEDAFERCDRLEFISIQGNRYLTAIPNGIFKNCQNLLLLHISSNDLRSLQAEIFEGLSNLDELSVGWNPIESLPIGVFSNLTNLRILRMEGCRLNVLNPGFFIGLVSLISVNLFGNEITHIPRGAFNDSQNLQTLRLNWNRINRLDSFSHLPVLHIFDIGNNRMGAIEPDFFTNFPILYEFSSVGNNCVNQRVLNVSQIDFEEDPVFNQCFANWLITTTTATTTVGTTPSGGVNFTPLASFLTLTVVLILKV